MTKSVFTVIALTAALVGLLALRKERGRTAGHQEEGPTVSAPSTAVRIAPRPNRHTKIARSLAGPFEPEVLARTTNADNEPRGTPSPANRARDGYYDSLLLKQGRDYAKEQDLLRKLMTVFGDSPDTLVGPAACSLEFCRVELRGVGEVNVRERWQDALFAAVEPKGLKFLIVDADDEGNTMASCYFGRDESWTVPDFHALGLL